MQSKCWLLSVSDSPELSLQIVIFSLLFSSSLKVEYDKLANEKTEMQRHYVMVRLSYNWEQLWYQIARLVEDLVGVE